MAPATICKNSQEKIHLAIYVHSGGCPGANASGLQAPSQLDVVPGGPGANASGLPTTLETRGFESGRPGANALGQSKAAAKLEVALPLAPGLPRGSGAAGFLQPPAPERLGPREAVGKASSQTGIAANYSEAISHRSMQLP